MNETLLIVESPSKARTIQKYLGSGYKVLASFGHVMDLPKEDLGVEIENDFTPHFEITKKARKNLKEILAQAKKANKILLAGDPDREGEAICYHLSLLLKQKPNLKNRVELPEITKKVVLYAIENPVPIHKNRVESQYARRILDRIVGYKVSPILWKCLGKSTLSAGRVQSVVLRWICEREKEIDLFEKKEYWKVKAFVETKKGESFTLTLEDKEKKINSIESLKQTLESLLNQKNSEVKEGILDLKSLKKEMEVIEIKKEAKKEYPPPPFITASLQKEAGRKLKFSTKKTMQIAQKLYEGVFAGSDNGFMGLISYMRTDSTRINSDFKTKAKNFIEKSFGKEFVGNDFIRKQKKEIQDAHEAIRPTDISITPESLKGIINKDDWELYQLIWKRTIASLMIPAEILEESMKAKLNGFVFTGSGKKILTKGYLVLSTDSKVETYLPELKVGDYLDLIQIESEQKFTEPPPRYTEPTLVEKMEKEGVGRPSTYSNTIEVLYKRKYTTQKQKSIYPTELGMEVNEFLTKELAYLFTDHFTKDIEDELDKIAEGSLNRTDFLKKFYQEFSIKTGQISKQKFVPLDKKNQPKQQCPLCQSKVSLRKNPKGREYWICSRFPECEYMAYKETVK
ncbi:MAG TPA: type I DNA topoisomerase [Leptospiraceae bacterium]|nr:type I DNA topoisomerase [Leptospiraceae bacterium]HMW05627.1 type I DNA topoisomerase [Leptospiraceae bacterium]HMX34491.1 type I DNA topoisomerase [Leptospiraceae bacterium]HMY31136.1 type I DNA topoisomerase [Leptospiraceae bacterium]HMZ63719.1 type I DNA topoisomerase [Leptospiraceae bacterium]